MFFVGKRLHHADTADIILDPGIEIAHITEEPVVSGGHIASEVNNDPGHNRHDNEGYDSQLQIDVCH
ncbi:hypothetical protein D3C75_919090 [compost metagenome]